MGLWGWRCAQVLLEALKLHGTNAGVQTACLGALHNIALSRPGARALLLLGSSVLPLATKALRTHNTTRVLHAACGLLLNLAPHCTASGMLLGPRERESGEAPARTQLERANLQRREQADNVPRLLRATIEKQPHSELRLRALCVAVLQNVALDRKGAIAVVYSGVVPVLTRVTKEVLEMTRVGLLEDGTSAPASSPKTLRRGRKKGRRRGGRKDEGREAVRVLTISKGGEAGNESADDRRAQATLSRSLLSRCAACSST